MTKLNIIVEHQTLTSSNSLIDRTGQVGVGGTIDVSGDFIGLPRTYALTTAPSGVSIDQNGLVSYTAEASAGPVVVQVINDATPAGVSSGFNLTMQIPGQPVALYVGDFSQDATADFAASPASLAHAPADYAMVFGADGEIYPTVELHVDVESATDYQILFRSELIGSGAGTSDTFFQFEDVNGDPLGTPSDRDNEDGVYSMTSPVGSTGLKITMLLRGTVTGTKQYQLNDLQVWKVDGASGGFPNSTFAPPLFWNQSLSVGAQGPGLDFGGAFEGNITGYSYDGPEPHVWEGSVLKITPDVEILEPVDRAIRAVNGGVESFDSYAVGVMATTYAPMQNVETLGSMAVEVDRPFSMAVEQQVSGGSGDFVFTAVSLPSWLTLEVNGHIHGRAPLTAQVDETVRVDVMDETGAIFNVQFQMEVIPTIDRSTPVDIPLGSELLDETNNNAPFDPPQYAERDVMSWLKANAGSDRVFRLLDGVAYKWGNSYAAFNQPQNDPIIVMGENYNVTLNGVKFNQCSGLILEGFTLRRTGVTATDKDTRSKLNLIANTEPDSRHIRYYDMVVHADTVTIDPLAISGDGIPWNNSETFITIGVGITVGPWGIVDRCNINNVYAGINITAGEHAGVFDTQVVDFGIDGITIDRTEGAVVSGCSFKDPVGNYTDGTHRDLFQTFANNAPMPKSFVITNNFFSTSGVDGIQGNLLDLDGYLATNQTPKTGSNYRHVHRGNIILGSTDSHGWQYENFYKGVFDRMVVLAHPEVTRNATVDMRRHSHVDFSNSIVTDYSGGSGGDHFDQWKHLCTFVNMEVMTDTLTPYTAIFPNWNNGALPYEDPREAVANGLNANQARFWIDPNSVWGLANPDVGPSWLRTG